MKEPMSAPNTPTVVSTPISRIADWEVREPEPSGSVLIRLAVLSKEQLAFPSFEAAQKTRSEDTRILLLACDALQDVPNSQEHLSTASHPWVPSILPTTTTTRSGDLGSGQATEPMSPVSSSPDTFRVFDDSAALLAAFRDHQSPSLYRWKSEHLSREDGCHCCGASTNARSDHHHSTEWC